MSLPAYHVVSENSEDRYDSADTLDDALRLAREWTGETVSIEDKGLVVRQLVLTADGRIEEEALR